MTNIAMEAMALIEIDGLPIKHGDFPWQTVSHNQMVNGDVGDCLWHRVYHAKQNGWNTNGKWCITGPKKVAHCISRWTAAGWSSTKECVCPCPAPGTKLLASLLAGREEMTSLWSLYIYIFIILACLEICYSKICWFSSIIIALDILSRHIIIFNLWFIPPFSVTPM